MLFVPLTPQFQDGYAVGVFDGVEDLDGIMKNLAKSDVILMRSGMIASVWSLSMAIGGARQAVSVGTSKTRGVGTEVLYRLSPSSSIKDSLKGFGISFAGRRLIVAVPSVVEGDEGLRAAEESVKTVLGSGQDVSPSSLEELDALLRAEVDGSEELEKLYKISREEKAQPGWNLSEAVERRVGMAGLKR